MVYILALAVALGSLALYLAGFLFPTVYRQRAWLVWSGVGLFYALVLWVCGGQIGGGLLLGQMAAVALLGWLGWQMLQLQWQLTPIADRPTRSWVLTLGQQTRQMLQQWIIRLSPQLQSLNARQLIQSLRQRIQPPTVHAPQSPKSPPPASPPISPESEPLGEPDQQATPAATLEPVAAAPEPVATAPEPVAAAPEPVMSTAPPEIALREETPPPISAPARPATARKPRKAKSPEQTAAAMASDVRPPVATSGWEQLLITLGLKKKKRPTIVINRSATPASAGAMENIPGPSPSEDGPNGPDHSISKLLTSEATVSAVDVPQASVLESSVPEASGPGPVIEEEDDTLAPSPSPELATAMDSFSSAPSQAAIAREVVPEARLAAAAETFAPCESETMAETTPASSVPSAAATAPPTSETAAEENVPAAMADPLALSISAAPVPEDCSTTLEVDQTAIVSEETSNWEGEET